MHSENHLVLSETDTTPIYTGACRGNGLQHPVSQETSDVLAVRDTYIEAGVAMCLLRATNTSVIGGTESSPSYWSSRVADQWEDIFGFCTNGGEIAAAVLMESDWRWLAHDVCV